MKNPKVTLDESYKEGRGELPARGGVYNFLSAEDGDVNIACTGANRLTLCVDVSKKRKSGVIAMADTKSGQALCSHCTAEELRDMANAFLAMADFVEGEDG